jgi:hypothetical protein
MRAGILQLGCEHFFGNFPQQVKVSVHLKLDHFDYRFGFHDWLQDYKLITG